jgi:hypothetical protein
MGNPHSLGEKTDIPAFSQRVNGHPVKCQLDLVTERFLGGGRGRPLVNGIVSAVLAAGDNRCSMRSGP